jgi:hypothetical protein
MGIAGDLARKGTYRNHRYRNDPLRLGPGSAVLFCGQSAVAPLARPWSLSSTRCRFGRFRREDPGDRGEDASPLVTVSAKGKPG